MKRIGVYAGSFDPVTVGHEDIIRRAAQLCDKLHVTVMYNINKRLANVSYHDIADDADASDVFTHYRSLYSSLAEELEKQDNVYCADKEKGFCQAFKSCCFYGAITASPLTASGKQNKDYNPFIEDVLVSIVASTVRANATRKRVGENYL